MMNKIKKVKMPENGDLEIIMPDGERLLLQHRADGGTYPSLDICFDKKRIVENMNCDLSDAPALKRSHAKTRKESCRVVEQLWIGLDPKQPDVKP